MAFVARRFFSASALARNGGLLRYSVSLPAPTVQTATLETAELQQLAQKSKGSWKELNKEEIVKLYRTTFPQTFKEMKGVNDGHYKVIIPGILVGCTAAVLLFYTLRSTIGPEMPHTYNNPEWDAAQREYLIRQKSNPISGISSMQKST